MNLTPSPADNQRTKTISVNFRIHSRNLELPWGNTLTSKMAAESRSTLQRIVKHATFVKDLVIEWKNQTSKSARFAKGRAVIGMLTMMLALLQIITGRSLDSDIRSVVEPPIDTRNCTIFANECCIPEFGWDSWNGMIVFISGLLGVFCHRSRLKLIIFLVMAIVAATSSAIFTTWLTIDLITNTDSPSTINFFLLVVLFMEMVSCIVGASFTCGPICYAPQVIVSQHNRDHRLQGRSNDRSLSISSTSHMECTQEYDFRKEQYSVRVYSEINWRITLYQNSSQGRSYVAERHSARWHIAEKSTGRAPRTPLIDDTINNLLAWLTHWPGNLRGPS